MLHWAFISFSSVASIHALVAACWRESSLAAGSVLRPMGHNILLHRTDCKVLFHQFHLLHHDLYEPRESIWTSTHITQMFHMTCMGGRLDGGTHGKFRVLAFSSWNITSKIEINMTAGCGVKGAVIPVWRFCYLQHFGCTIFDWILLWAHPGYMGIWPISWYLLLF